MTGEATQAAPGTPAGDGHDALDERALVDSARLDRAAFAVLYRHHVDAVYAFAFRRCGSKEVAEEATSATFERALRAIGQFEWRAIGVRPWLLRIASNEVAEIYRQRDRAMSPRGRMALHTLSAAAAAATTAADPAERVVNEAGGAQAADLAAMHRALDRINERYRSAISLRYLAGMTAADAATEMGCSKGVLAVTLHRALRALRTEMERQPREGGAG